MAEGPPAPEGLAVTFTANGFNVQARTAIITMGIDNVDEASRYQQQEPEGVLHDACQDGEAPVPACEVQDACN